MYICLWIRSGIYCGVVDLGGEGYMEISDVGEGSSENLRSKVPAICLEFHDIAEKLGIEWETRVRTCS